jgi:hypothetical protein
MFYLIYVMFLFAGHNGLSVVTGAASCGDARPGAAHPRGARGSQGVGRVDIRG